MTVPKFRLEAVTRIERHAATQLARRAISDAGGWLTNFRQFSNFAVVLDIEIKATRLAGLHQALEAVGFAPTPPRDELPMPHLEDSDLEIEGALRLCFVHDEPDLRVDVPAVPG